jgi:GNAT superfamily N-acetyltransferase
MSFTLELSDAADDAVRMAIAKPLIAYNAAQTGISDYRPLAVVVRDDAGEVIGGLWGRTVYGWLYVELLVVPEALRGRDVGTALMDRAEEEAVTRGCRAAWLDTFSFQARGFYEKRGYRCFGELHDYPPGFSRLFMAKNLDRR